MKHLIITLSILLALVSCKKDKYYNLDHSKWFKYKINDTLVFNSKLNQDSFFISEINNYYIEIDKRIYHEGLTIIYQKFTSCNNCPISGFNRGISGVAFSGNFHYSTFEYNITPSSNFLLNDNLIENVYNVNILTDDTIRFQVKSIYYSDIYGIIRYDMYNDEVFELQLK